MNPKSVFKIVDLASAVEAIGILPDILISDDINFDTVGERAIIKSHKYLYKGLKEWLKHLVLKESLNPEVFQSKWKYYQPHAMLSYNLLNLITGLHPRIPELQQDNLGKNAPIIIWFLSQRYECKKSLKASGILGKPSISGKNDFMKQRFDLLDGFGQDSIRLINPHESQESMQTFLIDFEEAPVTYLESLAARLINKEKDSNFDIDYWKPYEFLQRRYIRKIRDDKHLQSECVLNTGERFRTGKGKKIPNSARNSKKGLRKVM
jgi:hypothetical protein